MHEASLTARRRAATQRDIAIAAADLFAEHGTAGVTAERIAAAAGVSIRTFFRYAARKEDAVAPLLTIGAARWQRGLRAIPAGDPLPAIAELIEFLLTPEDREAEEDQEFMSALLRAAESDRSLREVWYRVNFESEERVRGILEDRDPNGDAFEARLLAGSATLAIRLGLEEWAATGAASPAALATRAFRSLTRTG